MEIVIRIATLVIAVGGIIAVIWMSIYTVSAGSLNVWKGHNDDDSVSGKLIELLDMTKKEIVIFDDGDDAVLYGDEALVKAFEQKIKEGLPGFRVRCFFNSPEMTLFRKTLNKYENVEIKCGDGKTNRPSSEVHFKIIDDGLAGYLSIHAPGSRDRTVKIVDCSPIFLKSTRKKTSKKLLGPHLRKFESMFSSTAA